MVQGQQVDAQRCWQNVFFFSVLNFIFYLFIFVFFWGKGYKGGGWDMERLENGWDWGA